MTKPKWFALLILAFAVMIIPRIVSILFAVFSGGELRGIYDVSEFEEDEHIRLLVFVWTHWIYVLLAVVSAAAIFTGKSWAPLFWLASCAIIFVGVLIETIVFEYEWSAFWFEAVFTITSLLSYRSDRTKGWLQSAHP
jgi:hypothetical protein